MRRCFKLVKVPSPLQKLENNGDIALTLSIQLSCDDSEPLLDSFLRRDIPALDDGPAANISAILCVCKNAVRSNTFNARRSIGFHLSV
mmetsp:Transcript_21173/g.32177  ORF Transcript_21173/g.32177 Transcript_21173/m.32177 type:complete len:88 (-) Transcript_21173:1334-1597(-)